MNRLKKLAAVGKRLSALALKGSVGLYLGNKALQELPNESRSGSKYLNDFKPSTHLKKLRMNHE